MARLLTASARSQPRSAILSLSGDLRSGDRVIDGLGQIARWRDHPITRLGDRLVEGSGAARHEHDGDGEERRDTAPEIPEDGAADDDAPRDRDEVRRREKLGEDPQGYRERG